MDRTRRALGDILFLRIEFEGQEYEGRITAKNVYQGKGKSYSVVYAFTVDEVEYSQRASLGRQDYETTNIGDTVSVRALASSPEKAHWVRLPQNGPRLQLGAHWFLAAFWNGILSIFIYLAWIRPYRHPPLVRCGVPVVGRVTATMNKGISSSGLQDAVPRALRRRSPKRNEGVAASMRIDRSRVRRLPRFGLRRTKSQSD